MRETSYHVVITEMTVRALWETQNVLDCIPDALWDIRFGGAPVWQHIYHMLHELDQFSVNKASLFPEIDDVAEYIKLKYNGSEK